MATLAKGEGCWGSVSKANQRNDSLQTHTGYRERKGEREKDEQKIKCTWCNAECLATINVREIDKRGPHWFNTKDCLQMECKSCKISYMTQNAVGHGLK